MLGFGALNNDTDEISERETPLEIIQEAQESEALALYHEALAFQKSGNFQEAERIYLDVLQTDLLTKVPCPSNMKTEEILENSGLLLKYTVYKNLGDISYGVEDHEKALDNYLEAALIDESDVSLWWRIGDIALKVTNLKLARYSFEKGLIYSPKHWPCLENLVTVLFAIGDYAACLEAIIKGLKHDDMFTKGLVIRDQIFKEENHFRREYQDFHVLFENENREDYYNDNCVKYIEEALVLREKRCLSSRKEDLPKTKLSKPLTYFTWACLGDCLIHQYDELTNPENPKSLCRPLDIEKYSRTPEQQTSLAIPSPETNWRGAKQSSKEEERKSIKRKKVQTSLFEKDGEPVAKRRSARVKSSKKEEDINWAETLQSFLPDFLRADSATENEDSQDSIAEDISVTQTSSTAEVSHRTNEEAKIVSDFINKNVRNSGCIDLMSKFIEAVTNQTEASEKWYHGLPQIYLQIFKRVKKHIQYPEIPPREGCKDEFVLFAKMLLFALELQLDDWLAVKSKVPVNFSPGKPSTKTKKSDAKSADEKPKGTEDFAKDMQFFMFMTSFEVVFKERWIEFLTRFNWVEARFYMLIGETKQAIRAFDKCIVGLSPENGTVPERNLTFNLQNCTCDSVLNLENVQRKVESLQRCLSLLEVNKLYEDEKYAEVVDLLMPLLKQRKTSFKDNETTSSPAERPTQLLLLQDSLSKLGQIKKCIICSEIAIKETVQQMTPTEDWKILLNGFLDCLNRSLTSDVLAGDLLPENVTFGLTQSMKRIVEMSMESLDNNELVLATSVPWLIVYKIVKCFDPSVEPNESGFSALREMLAVDDNKMPTSFQFIRNCHDLLGRRCLCCDDDGILLLAFSKDLKRLSNYLMPQSKKEAVLKEVEQCFYCLFGHPSKKTKSRKLQDHVTSQTSLTWEYAQIVYDYFKPPGLPTLDNKINTVSMEVQLLLRRIVAVVPQKEVEVISFDSLQAFIDGSIDFPLHGSEAVKNTQIQDLFYYLGDYYFKNKEFSKALKFYMHDICMNPKRFESWAAMALARGSRLEEKISAHEPKSDGPIRKNTVSTLRCFEKAVELNDRNCMILEEYGSTSYMLNSQASRRLRELIQDEEYTNEAVLSLIDRRNEMLQLSEKCFIQAKSLVKRAEGEPWLHSFMLGKTSERLGKPANEYLNHYQLAAHQLYVANANYPKRIPYHNPPEYSIESLEMFYRMHASVINIFQKNPGNIDYNLIEEYLSKAETSPFALGVNKKSTEKISKEDSATDVSKQSPSTQTSLEKSCIKPPLFHRESSIAEGGLQEFQDNVDRLTENSCQVPVSSKNEFLFQESQSLFSENSQSDLIPSQANLSESLDRPQQQAKLEREYEVDVCEILSNSEKTTSSSQEDEKDGGNLPDDNERIDDKEIASQSRSMIGRDLKSAAENAEKESVGKDSCTKMAGDIPNLTIPMVKREFSSKEEELRYKEVIDRCMEAFSLCLKRFPEHYKSQYKIAFVATYFDTHRDLQYGKDLLIGSSSNAEKHSKFVPQHGLFTDKSKTNLFQYLWRIPIDEVDRRGSFCSHICKAVELLLHVLSELKEWETLLTVSSLLHLTPSKDKKYLRDNDRLLLALKAFDVAKDILKNRIDDAFLLTRTEKKLLLLDCFEAYRHAQKMQTSVQITEHFLTKLFQMLLHQPDESPELSPSPEKVLLEQAVKFCMENAESGRRMSAAGLSSSTQSGTEPTVKNVNSDVKRVNDTTLVSYQKPLLDK